MSARGSDLLRLRTIVECVDEIRDTVGEFGMTQESYAFPDGTLERVCRRGVDMLMLQLCEEAREVTEETRSRMPQIPWRSVAEVRNFLIHRYGAVDAPTVWGFISGSDISELREACANCVAEIERGDYVPRFGSRTQERRAGGGV